MPHAEPPTAAAPPVIDARRLAGRGDPTLVADVRRAAAGAGYLLLDNAFSEHGAERALLAAARRFFALPDRDPRKQSICVTGRSSTHGWMPLYGEPAYLPGTKARVESFDCGLPWRDEADAWPALPGFREAVQAGWRRLTATGLCVLQSVALAAGLPRDYLRRRCGTQSASTMRLLHYPGGAGATAAQEVGISAHTDFECITLLYQTAAGLELRDRAGRWHEPPAGCDRLLVLFGDMLERWTNGRFLATPHRVRLTAEPRLSVVLFFAVDEGIRVAPLAQLLRGDETPAYGPVTQREHSARRLARAVRNRDSA